MESKEWYATWYVSLETNCPKCDNDIDLLGMYDDLPEVAEIKGGLELDVTCKCGHKFIVTNTEY